MCWSRPGNTIYRNKSFIVSRFDDVMIHSSWGILQKNSTFPTLVFFSAAESVSCLVCSDLVFFRLRRPITIYRKTTVILRERYILVSNAGVLTGFQISRLFSWD